MSELSREDYMCYVNSVNSWSEKLCNRYLNDIEPSRNTKCSMIVALISVRKSNPPFKQIIYESIFEELYKPLRNNQKVSKETLTKNWF